MEAVTGPIDDVLIQVAGWAAANPDIRAIALVGSYAREEAGPGSDIDLVVLTSDPGKYISGDEWVSELGLGDLVQTKSWGAITERRLRRGDGLQIEFGIGELGWASVDPIDPGTRQVVGDAMRPFYDPGCLLERLIRACS